MLDFLLIPMSRAPLTEADKRGITILGPARREASIMIRLRYIRDVV